MTNQRKPCDEVIDLTGAKPVIKKTAPVRARAPTRIRSSQLGAAPLRGLVRALSGNGSNPNRPKIKKEPTDSFARPSKTIKLLSLDEQRDLDRVTKRVEAHRKPKRHWCSYCRCFIYQGVNSVTEKYNWYEHRKGDQHKRAVELRDKSWQKGCAYCPGKKFDNKEDFLKHCASKDHKAQVARVKRLEFLQPKADK